MSDIPIYSVHNTIDTILTNTSRNNGGIDEKQLPEAETISRTLTGMDIIEAILSHAQLNIGKEACFEQIMQETHNGLGEYGLEVRHLELWFKKPVEELCTQLNRMAYQNLIIRTKITKEDMKRIYEQYDRPLTDEDLASVRVFRDKYLGDYVDDSIST
ncbi:MAG: hypothetical protein ACLFMZ_11190 [Spirochaetaceae bacterium]